MKVWTGERYTMAMTDTMISALTTLLVTVDPPGLAPLFLGLTQGMTRAQRQQVAVRGSVMGFAILTVFALFGATILGALGISMGAFRIAGGLMLFAIAFEMIFEKRNERKEKTTDDAITKDHIHNLAVFPLAIPLIAGPGTMDGWIGKLQLIAVIGVVLGLVYVSLYLAERLNRFLGVTGRALLTRLLGVLLAALSVQFVVDGVKSAFAG
jgi:multiple antibiotic resistance protein